MLFSKRNFSNFLNNLRCAEIARYDSMFWNLNPSPNKEYLVQLEEKEPLLTFNRGHKSLSCVTSQGLGTSSKLFNQDLKSCHWHLKILVHNILLWSSLQRRKYEFQFLDFNYFLCSKESIMSNTLFFIF